MHAPAWQASDCVHRLPSSHADPLAFAGFEHVPVAGSHVPVAWHWFCAVHTTGFAPTHAPATHASLWVHRLPSSHAVPSAFGGFEHAPVAGLHTPATRHASWAVHATGFAPTQKPATQLSVCVHGSPSSHAVPSAAVGFVHSPVAESHVPAAWHASCAVHVTGFAPTHAPAWQASDCVHRLPSSHPVPLTLGGFEHNPVAGLHVPTPWH